MKKYFTLPTVLLFSFCISDYSHAAINCNVTPSCADLGYKKTTECDSANHVLKCPFDLDYVYCLPVTSSSGGGSDSGGGTTCSITTQRDGSLISTNNGCPYDSRTCYVDNITLDVNYIGNNNYIFSSHEAGCSSGVQTLSLRPSSGPIKIGSNVHISPDIDVAYHSVAPKGSVNFNGSNNILPILEFQQYEPGNNSNYWYEGGVVVFAGTTNIETSIVNQTTKDITILVGNGNGEPGDMVIGCLTTESDTGDVTSTNRGRICIGLDEGAQVEIGTNIFTYNQVNGRTFEILPSALSNNSNYGNCYYEPNTTKKIYIGTQEACMNM